MIDTYESALNSMVGPTKIMICGDTLQVKEYDRYNWTMFDAKAKQARHDAVFPKEKENAFSLGADLVSDPWA